MKEIINKYKEDKLKLETYQKVGVVLLTVVLAGIFGWIYEFILYYFDGGCKEFYMQGGNFLPWINIYAYGALLVMFFTKKIRNKPLLVFIAALVITGLLEYFSGLVIYKIGDGLRLWDYNQEIWNFGNIGGFICLRSVLFFGVSSLLLIYGIVPFCIYLSKKMSKKVFLILSITLFSIVMFDEVYNLLIARVLNLPRAADFYKSLGFKYVKFN